MSLRFWFLFVAVAALLVAAAAPPALGQELGPPVLPPPGSPTTLLGPSPNQSQPETLPPFSGAEQIDAGAVASPIDVEVAPTPTWYEPAYWFGPVPWDAGVEFGLNGSEGNNNVLSLRAGGHLKRKTKQWKLDASLQYNKNHTNGVETQNNGKMDLRLDRILDESPWSLFFLENLIYDEFQAFDIQLSLNTGVGYEFLSTETLNLLGRFGAGATREIGGVDNNWKPQALFGVEYEHQITTLQKLVAKVDYFPEWEDFRDYRVVSDIGWQIDLDQPKNVSLKLSLVDRYDSTPDGVEPNNFDYAVLLIWHL